MPKGGAPTFCHCGRQVMGRGLCPNHYKQWQYRQNPEKYRAWEVARRLRDPEAARAADRKRYADSPETKKAGARRYKTRRRGATGSHTEAEWQARLAEFGGRCMYCGDPATTRDHVFPISLGGTDDISNIAPACQPCNSSKNDRPLGVWVARRDLVTIA